MLFYPIYSVFIFAISSSTSKSLPVQGDVGIIASLALYLSSCGPGTIWGQVRLSVSLTGGLTPTTLPTSSCWFFHLQAWIALIFCVDVKVKDYNGFSQCVLCQFLFKAFIFLEVRSFTQSIISRGLVMDHFWSSNSASPKQEELMTLWAPLFVNPGPALSLALPN